MPKLNYGCGEATLEGYINVDTEKNKQVTPDVIADIKKSNLPFENEHFDEVVFMHCIEHIEKFWWPKFFEEFRRVLKKDGRLIMGYPEFEVCAKYFIENHKGGRDFWRKTLYGRQQWPGDYHVVPMRTEEVVVILSHYGFYDIKYGPEAEDEWNTFLVCKRGEMTLSIKELYRKEIVKIGEKQES